MNKYLLDKDVGYLNKSEAANYLGISRGTLDNWIKEGRLNIPYDVTITNRYRFRLEDLTKLKDSLKK